MNSALDAVFKNRAEKEKCCGYAIVPLGRSGRYFLTRQV